MNKQSRPGFRAGLFIFNANNGHGVTLKEEVFCGVFLRKYCAKKTPQAVKTTDNPSFWQGQAMRNPLSNIQFIIRERENILP
jgi:hypothetical protein